MLSLGFVGLWTTLTGSPSSRKALRAALATSGSEKCHSTLRPPDASTWARASVTNLSLPDGVREPLSDLDR